MDVQWCPWKAGRRASSKEGKGPRRGCPSLCNGSLLQVAPVLVEFGCCGPREPIENPPNQDTGAIILHRILPNPTRIWIDPVLKAEEVFGKHGHDRCGQYYNTLMPYHTPSQVSIHLKRMGSNFADNIPRVGQAEGPETNIEIKIKTLDSQTYTLRVDKQMPVPALKEQVASVTGVLSEQQRLICRGKVLKDDQLLSAYLLIELDVEDGHTLHLVVRQPIPLSSEGLSNHPGNDPASGSSRHAGQVAPSVVIETFSVPDQGDGVPPEISRIVSAVLGSFGLSNIGGGSEGVDVARERGSQRTSAAGGTMDASQLQSEQTATRGQSDRAQNIFGLPTAASLGSLNPPVISDSLTTLSQYLSHMGREFDAIGRGRENNSQADAAHRTEQIDSNSTSLSGTGQERFPTPASLAEVMLSSRQLLTEQVADCLLQLARQLENQANVTDPAARHTTQSSALRTGVQLHNLGALLLELGRTIMTLRLGQAPSEAVVNAGPAVFINQSGPNPLMVQPLPFQTGTSFGAIPVGSIQSGSGLANGIGTGFLPRRIDIQIRRGSSTATPNNNREERGQTQQTAGQRNPPTGSGSENPSNQTTSRVPEGSSFAGEAVRVVPLRTVVAAVPGTLGRLPSDSSGNSVGLYYPVLGRFQHVASGHGSGGRGSQATVEHPIAGIQTEQPPTPEPPVQRQNVEQRTRDGNVTILQLDELTNLAVLPGSLPPNSRQEPSISRSISVNILSASGAQNNQDSERHIPNSILQLLRTILPGDIHMEDASSRGTTTSSIPETAGPSTATAEAEPRATDEGIFLSNLLREIMPLIPQSGGAEPNATPPGEAHTSGYQRLQDSSTHAENSGVGTSRRHSDTEPTPPNSKRQKSQFGNNLLCESLVVVPLSVVSFLEYLILVYGQPVCEKNERQFVDDITIRKAFMRGLWMAFKGESRGVLCTFIIIDILLLGADAALWCFLLRINRAELEV
ncbi:unnamed protein product [Dovyalis caffra]|uniref:Ubiquitin-like domain-containing protein n=1 Tax=Dovyalis caffra TaxID=77055 RepID=A0AAV1RP90_9ROSI|nr:unnamed protein product [Dovyalis caffra]